MRSPWKIWFHSLNGRLLHEGAAAFVTVGEAEQQLDAAAAHQTHPSSSHRA
jgi:hypothetical protein